MKQKIIYRKKVEDENDVYRYYIIRKDENEYYVKADIINYTVSFYPQHNFSLFLITSDSRAAAVKIR